MTTDQLGSFLSAHHRVCSCDTDVTFEFAPKLKTKRGTDVTLELRSTMIVVADDSLVSAVKVFSRTHSGFWFALKGVITE